MNTLTQAQAQTDGFESITQPYQMHERRYFEAMVLQMAGTRSVIVQTGHGPEIWRHKSELKKIADPSPISATEAKRKRHFGR